MELGPHSYVGDFGSVTAKVTVGAYTGIAPFVEMHSRTQHGCIDNPMLVSASCGSIPHYPVATSRDDITIGSDVWIGRNAVLLGGITIGHGAIIGAYSVVAKDIPPYAVAVGNPVQILRFRFNHRTIQRLLTVAWWDWPDDVIAERADDLRDVRTLIAKYAYDVFPEKDK